MFGVPEGFEEQDDERAQPRPAARGKTGDDANHPELDLLKAGLRHRL